MFDDQSGTGNKSHLWIVKPDKSFWGAIKEKEEGTIVTVKQDSQDEAINGSVTWIRVVEVEQSAPPTGNQLNYVDSKYFPEIFFPALAIEEEARKNHYSVYKKLDKIKYRDYKFVLQALSIPLKFRKSIENLPYQTETGVNIAFGTGLKWSYNWYEANKTFLGQKTNNLSFIPGILLGFGAVDIKGGVTAPTGFKDRKEPIFSYGSFFMFGFNNINIGFVIGKDVALKDGGKAGGWIYNHKTWTGIAIGLDIIK